MISITCMLVIATIQSKIDRMLPKVDDNFLRLKHLMKRFSVNITQNILRKTVSFMMNRKL